MKTIKLRQTMVLTSVAMMAALHAPADQPTPATGPEKLYIGQITAVDPQDRMVTVKSWPLSKKEFNLGSTCSYQLWEINNGTAADLRPGQKISVTYQESQGVNIADRLEQQPMQIEGMVTVIDPNTHTLTLHREGGFNEQIVLADGCGVALRDNRTGVLTDIQPGDHVTVTYETPNDTRVARQIAQTSMEFTGKVTAIDLDQKMVKAKGAAETKKFNLANDCAIVINGRTDGKLGELAPNEKLEFTYDTINGVNVVNRIAPAPVEPRTTQAVAPTTTPTTSPTYAYPGGF